MRAVRDIPQYTVKDYQQWEGDWELIDGIPFSMAPSPFQPHQRATSKLWKEIDNELEKKEKVCGKCEVEQDLDWIVDDTTVLRPDIAIICEKTTRYITTPPILIIESLSASTAHKDKNLKFEIYEEKGVKYYLIVDPTTKKYQSFELIEGRYKEIENLTTFVIHNECSIEINVLKVLSNL
jgi:Uma2 family endonuclease